MCSSTAFFPPTGGVPSTVIPGSGVLLGLFLLGGILWLAVHWLNQQRTGVLPYALSHWEGYRKVGPGPRSQEPKQEHEQPGIHSPQETPPQE